MSYTPKEPPTNGPYDPLPLTHDEHFGDTLYNAPPSPGGHSQTFHTPEFDPRELAPDESGMLPVGAAQPRFLGAALYSQGDSRIRDSYASSHNTFPEGGGGSEFGNSVYALNDPLGGQNLSQTQFDGGYRDDPRDDYFQEPGSLAMSPVGQSRYLEEKRATYVAPRTKSKRKIMILAVLVALILLIAAVLIPLYFAVIKPKSQKNISDKGGSSSAKPSESSKPGSPSVAVVTGGDGSKVTTEDGSSFTYSNSFGGYWYWDENDPFNNGAKAQSSTPALNETFHYGVDKIRGVNLGGWLVVEPFMQVSQMHKSMSYRLTFFLKIHSVPALFEPYLKNTPQVVDEWTLSQADGGKKLLEEHYKTFITEKDFAQIAGAGLNYVRIPLGYWAIEVRDNEPFIPKTSWTYFLKAIQWARKYGIRINLDFHALPGSQNGWNHSGRLGTVNMLNGPMGLANAQRSLDYIRIIAQFISQPQYRDVVTMFGITNEPRESIVGKDQLSRFYLEAYKLVRDASGVGEGKGPYISFHDAFLPRAQWADFLPNADRISLDSHPYLCFGPQSDADMASYATSPCGSWGGAVNTSMEAFGLTNAGEFSNAVTDCGKWLNGVELGTRYEGTYTAEPSPRVGSCDKWTKWEDYDTNLKNDIKNFAMASMDALQDWFFWTWKIGNSSVTGKVESPAWSYQLGLENDWMPKDPNSARGVCKNASPWNPPLKAWQTGGAGAGDIPASVSASFAWPPPSISNAGAATLLPSYTPTGAVPTLPGPSFTGSKATATPSAGNGWANPSDTAGLMVAVAGCNYLDPWVGSAAPPEPLCSGKTVKKRLEADWEDVPAPLMTPPPT